MTRDKTGVLLRFHQDFGDCIVLVVVLRCFDGRWSRINNFSFFHKNEDRRKVSSKINNRITSTQMNGMQKSWSVYCLIIAFDNHCTLSQSHRSRKCTYVGATTDLNRRLKQHNGQLAGGAKTTRLPVGGFVWQIAAHVSGFPDERAALQFEWRWKRLSRESHECSPLARRMNGLATLLCLERPTKSAAPFSSYKAGLSITLETEDARVAWKKAATVHNLSCSKQRENEEEWPSNFDFNFSFEH